MATESVQIPLLETERALAAVIVTEPRALIPLWAVLKPADVLDPLVRRIYDAALELAHEQTIPNPYTLAQKLPDVPLEVLLDFNARCNPQLVEQVLALAEIIRQAAAYRRLAAVTADIADQAKAQPANLEQFVFSAVQRLTSSVDGQVDRPSDLATIMEEVDQEIAAGDVLQGFPTGFGWLTERIGGFKPGRIVALIAPYKARKSSTMRNMVLAAAHAKKHVMVYVLEGQRIDLAHDLWAMLATRWLWDNLDPPTFYREAYLDGEHLALKLRSPLQHEALEATRAEMTALGQYIRVMDGRDAINDLGRFAARLRRDHFLYRTDMLVLDHLQLMETASAEIFKKVEATVAAVQQFAITEGAVALILSQQNEAAIGMAEDSYSPGAKGGGALPAAADYILMTKYDSEKAPDRLRLRLKLSRRAQGGFKDYLINPTSGAVLAEYSQAPEEA